MVSVTDSRIAAFENRGSASEKRHVAENELTFIVEARRNRRLAVWMAGLLGFDEAHVPRYLDEIIAADLSRPGIEPVVDKLQADLRAKGVHLEEADLRRHILDFEAQERARLVNVGY